MAGVWTPGPGASDGNDRYLGDMAANVADGRKGDDVLDGGSGNDTLMGGDGNDTLIGGAGNDTLHGGGGIDVAVFAGPARLYSISRNAAGVVTVLGPDGLDVLTGVESLRFSDKTVPTLPVFSDARIVHELQTNWGGTEQGQTRTWAGTHVTYSVPTSAPVDVFGTSAETAGFVAPSAEAGVFAALAFELWDDLIAINLDPVTDPAKNAGAQITVAFSSTTRHGGIYAQNHLVAQPAATTPAAKILDAGRVWLNPVWPEFQRWRYGERGLEALLHEIGHTLGLSHPAPYDVADASGPSYPDSALFTKDTLRWTVMSYFAAASDDPRVDRTGTPGRSDLTHDGVNAQTPLLYDILAVQQKYGADPATRTGDDTYGFHMQLSGPARPVFDFDAAYNPDPVIAIYDAGGHDTLDTSGYRTNQRISLIPGTLSDIGNLTQNVGIAFGTVIEDAVGGAGRDTIIGNAAANRLSGGAGGDKLVGGLGNDTLVGENGRDSLYGGAGDDRLAGGRGADRLNGGAGSDTFVFDTAIAASTDRDTIADFATGTDHIALERAVFGALAGLPAGALGAGALMLGSAATHAGDHLLYDQAQGLLLYDADGSGPGAAVQIALLAGAPHLDGGDIVLI
ncbi:MAG: M10 family metallopeptidase C-terminal domain-containing protein [Novosphingobium sp.]